MDWTQNVPKLFRPEGEISITAGSPAIVAHFFKTNGIRDQACQLLEQWLDMIPKDLPLYYFAEYADKGKKLTPKLLEKLKTDLSPKGLDKKYFYFMVNSSGNVVKEYHGYSLEFFATSNFMVYAYLTFPIDHVKNIGVETTCEWFSDWCENFDFNHATMGPGYEVGWDTEMESFAAPVIFETGHRYHGVRVFERGHEREREDEQKSLDTVQWLTFLRKDMIEEIGLTQLKNIHKDISRKELNNGILFRTGTYPDPCDTENPGKDYALLCSLNDFIRPIRTEKWESIHHLVNKEMADGWFSRMDK